MLSKQLHLPLHPVTDERKPYAAAKKQPIGPLHDNCHRCGSCHLSRDEATRCAQANSQSDRNGSH